ncbi:MAG TPA: pentapeptide repeat-containing protein [Pyrinomonadaceae bacterium]|nr:pentapeptide repeat-containing protein [Pyrinomonadaceae bacterium]
MSFEGRHFRKPVKFNSAVFNGGVSFDHATFDAGATFDAATFAAPANFQYATFVRAAYFKSAVFKSEADFSHAKFRNAADFDDAYFGGRVTFVGDGMDRVFDAADGCLSIRDATIEAPEQFSFRTLRLSPHWFVNVNARRFHFTNVDWKSYLLPPEKEGTGPTRKRHSADEGRKWRTMRARTELIKLKGVWSRHAMLEEACRNLAVNAEENHRYEDASDFRYLAMDARRLSRWGGFAFWTLGWWYWLASGYGERIGRAFLVLLGVMVIFAALYIRAGFPNWGTKTPPSQAAAETQPDGSDARSQLPSALLYSAGVMTLQKPEPRPATDAAQALVILETILGPVQAALLALAIRRKFMR